MKGIGFGLCPHGGNLCIMYYYIFIYFFTLASVTGTNKNNEVNISSVISTEETLLNGNSGEDM